MENAPPVGAPSQRGYAWRNMCAARSGGLRDQPGFEEDLVGGDLLDGELIEQFSSVEESEEVAGGFVLEGRPRVAVDVAHERVDVGLRQVVKGGSLRQDHADELVVALDAGLLVRGARIAVEDACAPLAGRVQFQGFWIGELGTVVGEQDGEQAPETVGSGQRPEPTEDVDDRLRVVAVPEEGQHEARADELQGQQDLATPAPDNGIHLDRGNIRIGGDEREVVGVRASDAALGVDLVFDGLARPGLEHADAGHVAVFGGQQASGDVAVDRLQMKIEAIGVVDEDMMDGLSFLDERTDQGVETEQFGLGDVRPAARLNQDIAIVPVSGFVDVVLFAQDAAGFFLAAVADEGSPGELRANVFLEVRANAVAARTSGAAPDAVRLVHAQLPTVAVRTVGAAVGDPAKSSLVAGDAPGKDLPRQGRMMLAELGGDLFERSTLPERVLNLQAFEVGEMLVLHFIGSFSCAMRDCNG